MNAMWRVESDGIAYVEDRQLALALIRSGVVRCRTLDGAMAVYYSARG